MSTTATIQALKTDIVSRLLDPVCDALTPDVAAALIAIRAPADVQKQLDDYAIRHHESQLSEEELLEYDALVSAVNLVSLLQAKARNSLKRRPSS